MLKKRKLRKGESAMKNIEFIIESKLQRMFLKYPEQKELSAVLFNIISETFQDDLCSIDQKKKKLKMVFDCIISILEKAREQYAKKQYVIDVLDIFLDKDIKTYLSPKLNIDKYSTAVKSARAELNCSQWSDKDSNHWQRAVEHFEKF